MMDLLEIVKKRRSIRRFTQEPLTVDTLETIIDAVRIAPSAANLQPLQYIIIHTKEMCDKIFPHTFWAGYITPAWRPSENERPTSYIAILNTQKENIYADKDIGIAMGYIVLLAESYDISSCILMKINKKELKSILKIPETVELEALIALGKKNEISIIEEDNTQVKYYRDDNNTLHVPKKTLDAIIHYNTYKT